MAINLTEQETARLVEIVVGTQTNAFTGALIVPENITDIEANPTLAGKTSIVVTQTVNGKTTISNPHLIKRESLGTVLAGFDISPLASVDFKTLTVEDVAELLTEIGVTIDADSITIEHALDKLLVIKCTKKSIRFEGVARILRVEGDDSGTEPGDNLESQSGQVIVDQTGDAIETNQ